jgi:hypothetical protein
MLYIYVAFFLCIIYLFLIITLFLLQALRSNNIVLSNETSQAAQSTISMGVISPNGGSEMGKEDSITTWGEMAHLNFEFSLKLHKE